MARMGKVAESRCEVNDQIILFGAGAAGHYALKHLRAQGIQPVAFVDNDPAKQDKDDDEIGIFPPDHALKAWPDATWVAAAISRPAAPEIREQMRKMGVKTKPLWECIPVCHGLPPHNATKYLVNLCMSSDAISLETLNDQYLFRESPDYDMQRDTSPISKLYFPDFITHREDEHFVDCGAADGDTIAAFRALWTAWAAITAYEPDVENFQKLRTSLAAEAAAIFNAGVGDFTGDQSFVMTGDYSAHLAGASSRDATDGVETNVRIFRMDDVTYPIPPTYIKMDIEGAELEALWGARKLIKKHKPVLAICAYHTSDHLYEIPLLIHAIQPEYRLFLRRYAEGAFELVWYAVPPERIKA